MAYDRKFLLLLLVVTMLGGCAAPEKDVPRDRSEDGRRARPDEMLFRQRAFPVGRIDQDARLDGLRQARQFTEAYNDARRWEPVGPTNIGGRLTDAAVDPRDSDVIYIGCAMGGLMKTTDGGESWRPLMDRAPTMAVGSVAIDPSDPDVVYVGTGEVNPGGGSAAFPGVGVYKSTDAGRTWHHVGLDRTRHIGRIVVDPSNSDVVFAAAMGALYTSNPERGLYRSRDGGDSWDQVLAVNDSTGCIDVAVDESGTVLAATWERIRRPWMRSFGGPGSGVYRSADGGTSWTLLGGGLPSPSDDVGRIGICIAASDPDVCYAVYADATGYFDGLYRSDDGGLTWARTRDGSLEDVYSSYGWWFGNVRVSPTNADRVFVLGLNLMRSSNGGNNWSDVGQSVHVDHHAMTFTAQDPDWVFLGNDGGAYLSSNGGSNWRKLPDLPATQFYACEIDASNPHRFYGGTQDNGTLRTWTGGADDWESILGGDGFRVRVDPTDSRYVYAEWQYGGFSRSTDGGDEFSYSKNGISEADPTNWNAPFVIDPSNSTTLYFGTNRVYRSTNRGSRWSSISGDLTSGGGGGNLTFGTVTTLAVSPVDPDYIYAGTDDGHVAYTSDGGSNWRDVSDGLPERWVTAVVAHPRSPESFFVTLSGFKWDEDAAHVYRTNDGGATWTSIQSNLPEAPVNAMVVDPAIAGTYYVATDLGVYTSANGGRGWRPLGRGLPFAVAMDLKLDPGTRTLAVATFGRSMWSLDLGSARAPVQADDRIR